MHNTEIDSVRLYPCTCDRMPKRDIVKVDWSLQVYYKRQKLLQLEGPNTRLLCYAFEKLKYNS